MTFQHSFVHANCVQSPIFDSVYYFFFRLQKRKLTISVLFALKRLYLGFESVPFCDWLLCKQIFIFSVLCRVQFIWRYNIFKSIFFVVIIGIGLHFLYCFCETKEKVKIERLQTKYRLQFYKSENYQRERWVQVFELIVLIIFLGSSNNKWSHYINI